MNRRNVLLFVIGNNNIDLFAFRGTLHFEREGYSIIYKRAE